MDNIPIRHVDKVVGYVIMSDEMQQLVKDNLRVWCIEHGKDQATGYTIESWCTTPPQHELAACYTPVVNTDNESSEFKLYATGQLTDSGYAMTNGPTPTLADVLAAPGYEGASIYELSDSCEHTTLFTWDVEQGAWLQHKTTWFVELTYFKRTGKYYSSGTCTILNVTSLYEIWKQVREMLKRGTWPGLIDGPHDFFTLVRVPEHPHDHPKLILP